ncbi:MAG TPA: UrcA family protein [Allosphingosinicella sp.]|jgi:UrcA family protein|nr:UrcA family protein [Allosphingosinicella sp.]
MKTIALAAAALLAASFAASPAPAQSGPEQRLAVSLAGLDLGTPEGRQALDLRLLHAARTACGTPSPADPNGRANQDECVAQLRTAAAAQVRTALASAGRQSQSVQASGR